MLNLCFSTIVVLPPLHCKDTLSMGYSFLRALNTILWATLEKIGMEWWQKGGTAITIMFLRCWQCSWNNENVTRVAFAPFPYLAPSWLLGRQRKLKRHSSKGSENPVYFKSIRRKLPQVFFFFFFFFKCLFMAEAIQRWKGLRGISLWSPCLLAPSGDWKGELLKQTAVGLCRCLYY